MSTRPVILVVDDEKLLRFVLCSGLKGLDCELIEAANGEQALQLARQHRPRVVLLDLNMPGVDGYQVLERLPELLLDCAVLVISGTVDEQAPQRVRALGAVDFLTKPVDMKGLRTRVQSLVAVDAAGEV